MANPFYIHPGSDLSQGLQGLATSVKQYGEIKKAKDEKERIEKLNEGAVEAFKTGDPSVIAEFSLVHPEVAQGLTQASKLRDDKHKDFYANTIFQVLQNPENIEKIAETRGVLAKAQGLVPTLDDSIKTEGFMEKFNEDPKGTLAKLEQELAFIAPEKYKAYREALGTATKKTADIQNFEYFQNLKETDPDLADAFGTGTGFNKDEKDETTAAAKNFNTYTDLLTTDPEKAKLFGDSIGINRVTPYTDMAKLKTDFDNKLISEKEFKAKKDDLLNPTMKNKTELTMAALRGNEEAKNTLKAMAQDDVTTAGKRSQASTKGKLTALYAAMDLDGVAKAILEGKETIDNVRNTFGVPIQEVVREKVLNVEPDFNFVQPRAIQKSLSSSLAQQQKNRGAMGSFVLNINGQLGKVDKIMNEVINRVGVRGLDLPFRELHTRFKGSGNERVLEAYMKEISVEIFKLSQGSTASVALLPEKGREEWEKIHDVNLSYTQLKKVLEGTRDMANIRLKSVNDEIKTTVERLGNIRQLENVYTAGPGEAGAEFENTITVINPDTGEEETWNTVTEERIK